MKARGIFVSLLIILICALTFLYGCSSGSNSPSSAKAITAYSVNGVAGTINETDKTITVIIPFSANLAELVATFTTTGANVKVGTTTQVSGVTVNNFTTSLVYIVTAADGTTVDYTVTVTLSSEKAITAYSLNGVAGTINESEKTIAVTMPSLTNVFSLVATFTTTGDIVKVGSTAQVSGVTANNFKKPLAYTVTAADGSTATYTVTVTVNRAWHNPASLTDNISPDGRETTAPNVTMDNNGNAIIVWYQSDSANYQIFKSEYRNGVWHNPANLSDNISPDGQDAEYPKVAMDDNGNAIIVWQQYGNIFKSEYRNGVWTHPVNLTDNISLDKRNAWYPQVAMDNNGNAIIVWEQDDGNNSQIFKSEYRNGVWTYPTSLADNISPDGRPAYNPQVAMDNNGNAIIVWSQLGSNYSYIFKSEYRNGVWTHPASLTDKISFDGSSASYPQVTMDNNGNAIIVWQQYDGSGKYQIFKSEYRSGIWTNPASLSDNISPDGQDAWKPQVAMDNNGNALIVWVQSNGTNYQVFKSEYRSGVWTNPASLADNISPDGKDIDDRTQVAMDDNGNAIIVWQQLYGDWQIFKSEYRNGTWINPTTSADKISPGGSWAAVPQVAMDNNGNALIVWVQYDDSGLYQIFKSEYR